MPRPWMEFSGSAAAHGVTEEELAAVLAKAARPHRPESVRSELIFSEPAASATAGIWRFSSDQWSAVLKVLKHSTKGSALWQSDEDVDHWYYWRREADAYSSGLFAAFTGAMRTPTCLGVFDRPDGSVGVWMEDLGDGVPAASWTDRQYGLAAEALGQAQAGSSTVAARATQPWLVRDWLRRFVERRGEFLGALASPGWDHPTVRQYLPPDTAERAADIWDRRGTLLAMVEEMPAVLTHNDMHPGNLFAVGSSTVLIDWGFMSIGGLGEDPGNLVFDAVLDFFVPPETFPALDQAVTAGYLKGVTATVPGIDVGAVQRAIWATGAVRYFWIPLAMVEAAAEERPTLNRRAIDDAFPAWAKLVPYIFEFASRAGSA